MSKHVYYINVNRNSPKQGWSEKEKDMGKHAELAAAIVENIGGKENITNFVHCVTRLRFNVADKSKINENAIQKLKVFGTNWSGEQFQVIIGNDVHDVYSEICEQTGIAEKPLVGADKPAVKTKKTPKEIGAAILDGLSGCLTPVIPLIIGSAMFKMVIALFGPMGSNLIQEGSNLYTLLNLVGDAGFFFLPVATAYTAAKKFNVSIMNALLIGFILIHPTWATLTGQPFTVYGIPTTIQSYGSTILPSILSVFVMGYVEKAVNRIIPKSLHLVFASALTIAIMLPIALCVLGPAGNFLGGYINVMLVNLHAWFGPLGVAVIAALYGFLVLTGMHTILVTTVMLSISTVPDTYLIGCLWCWIFAVLAIPLAIFLKAKNPDTKALAMTCLTAGLTAGVSEPTLFGLVVRFKRPLLTMSIGAAAGGLVSGILGVTCTSIVTMFSNFVGVVGILTTCDTASIIHWAISIAVAFIVTFVLTYKWGYTAEMDKM